MREQIKSFVIENTWLSRRISEIGWGNGYVIIPEGHPWHGMNYDDIPADVHGGLTFGEFVPDDIKETNPFSAYKGQFIIGFDTCHLHDTLDNWPKEAVEMEAQRLKEQALAACPLGEKEETV